MKISEFIKWLETKPQHLEVCVIETTTGYDGGDYYERTEAVCFDDPRRQSAQTQLSLILGVE